MVVVHYTASNSLQGSHRYMNQEKMHSARKMLKKAGLNNVCTQFLVGRDGKIYRLMPENQIGRHTIGLNMHAIGIENVGNHNLTDKQLEANTRLIRYLSAKWPIQYLIGHSEYRRFENSPLWQELQPGYRTHKTDPGKEFMKRLRKNLSDLSLKDGP